MTRRTTLKALHWLSFLLIAYLGLVEPQDVEGLGGAALATHAGMGTLLALLTTGWITMYLRKGLASRPGPKLPAWAKWAHPVLHKVMMWGLPAMVLSGALAGFAAPYAISAFGVIPLFPGIGAEGIHDLLTNLHEVAFNGLLIALGAHVAFHLWRHYGLRDNALRIMAPKALHKYL
ncbi:cytochrome b/b6 domain-containing protein [uncultured Tateyamaria sp.]|uniref:cytochrome b n=1 Tax=Tateyamaria sp. TaxID=1929288 RepID=UPI00262B5B91|nr:cytochrome b/b6 domain-containing protein [uncultured Tateyamaria sp.]